LIYTYAGPYQTRSQGKLISKNKKWKPLNKLTIDFRIGVNAQGQKVLELMKYANGTYALEVFRGRRLSGGAYELEGTEFIDTLRVKDNMGKTQLITVERGQIVEFAWDNKIGRFYPTRIRYDKLDPNEVKHAGNDVWTLIGDPIQRGLLLNELRGNKVLDLMRKFTNRVKKQLLTELKKTILTKGGANVGVGGKLVRPKIFDIGSGTGGDIEKWNDLQFDVICLEPSKANISEFENLAKIYNYSRYDLINGRGEDYEGIREVFERRGWPKVDAVTMMHSLTFFYDTGQTVENLIKTIKVVLKPQGRFVCLAMDGNLIHNQLGENNQLDIPKDTPAITIRRVNTPEGEAQGTPAYLTSRRVWIRMQAKMLQGGQYEYLVDFEDFIQRMERNGFELLRDTRLNAEAILSDTELWWIQMNRVVEFRYIGENKAKPGVNNKVDERLASLQDMLMRANQYYNVNSQLPMDTKLQLHGTQDDRNLAYLYPLYTVGVLGDGSCLLHSAVYCVNVEYKTANVGDRTSTIACLRQNLVTLFDLDEYAKLGGGNIAALGGDMLRINGDPTYSYSSLRDVLQTYSNPLGQEFIEFISNKIDINIHIVWWRGNRLQLYRQAANTLFNPARHNIVIYWQGGSHFQPIGLERDDGRLSFVFLTDEPLIQSILSVN
jgi:SAM-dependent methyltransferase